MSAVLERKRSIPQKFDKIIKKHDIYWADLGDGQGTEHTGIRPVLVITGEIGCIYSPILSIAPLSSKIFKFKGQPTQVYLEKNISNLPQDSIVMFEQVRSLDRSRFTDRISTLPEIFAPILKKARDVHFDSEWI